MSLAATLRPSSLSFASPLSSVYKRATEDTTSIPFQLESNYLALNRILIRYQNLILLVPSPLSTSGPTEIGTTYEELTPLQRQIQAELFSPLPYHRTKWLHNVQGARNLLLQLERQAQGIKVQRTKRDVLKDLSEKRSIIKRLRLRIEEIGREIESLGDRAWDTKNQRPDTVLLGDKVVDILGDVLNPRPKSVKSRRDEEQDDLLEGKPIKTISEDEETSQDQRDMLLRSSVRRRHGQNQDNTPSSPDKTNNKGQTSGFSNLASTEKNLSASSKTHEDLTASMVSMAAQLKQQTRAFEFTLNQDKGLLDRALEGLDRNVSAMDIASRNMAFLQRMSEGEGFFGRLKLYAIIFAMWVVAILLVFVMPKLRF